MAHSCTLLVGLTVAIAMPAGAQVRNINLTGAPLKAIEEPFTQISGVRELPGNKAVVVDRGEQKIMMVNFATGGVTSIGRKGGGPGEFQFPMGIFAGPGTDSWVSDPVAAKVHVVTADGKIPNAIVPPAGENNIGMTFPRGADGAGRLYFQGMPRPDQGGNMDSAQIVRWDRNAKRIDTLGKVATGMTINMSGSSSNMRVMISNKPWTPSPAWVVLPDGRVAVVQPTPYRVDIIGNNKMVTQGPVQPYTPIKVTAAERDAFRKGQGSGGGVAVTRSIGGAGGGTFTSASPAPARPPSTPDSDFPATMPPFTGQGGSSVMASPGGEIWVLRTRPASDKAPSYDIFNSSGVLTGKATLKPNSAVVGFGAGVIYVARQDPEDDLRYLEKYAR